MLFKLMAIHVHVDQDGKIVDLVFNNIQIVHHICEIRNCFNGVWIDTSKTVKIIDVK